MSQPDMNSTLTPASTTVGIDVAKNTLEVAIGPDAPTLTLPNNPEGFDAAKWVAAWLDRPQPALGGKRPAELMDTADGRSIVSDLVARMQSGAYT